MKSLANIIQHHREVYNLSQIELAKKAKVSKSLIEKIEGYNIKYYSRIKDSTLKDIAKVLQIDWRDLHKCYLYDTNRELYSYYCKEELSNYPFLREFIVDKMDTNTFLLNPSIWQSRNFENFISQHIIGLFLYGLAYSKNKKYLEKYLPFSFLGEIQGIRVNQPLIKKIVHKNCKKNNTTFSSAWVHFQEEINENKAKIKEINLFKLFFANKLLEIFKPYYYTITEFYINNEFYRCNEKQNKKSIPAISFIFPVDALGSSVTVPLKYLSFKSEIIKLFLEDNSLEKTIDVIIKSYK